MKNDQLAEFSDTFKQLGKKIRIGKILACGWSKPRCESSTLFIAYIHHSFFIRSILMKTQKVQGESKASHSIETYLVFITLSMQILTYLSKTCVECAKLFTSKRSPWERIQHAFLLWKSLLPMEWKKRFGFSGKGVFFSAPVPCSD